MAPLLGIVQFVPIKTVYFDSSKRMGGGRSLHTSFECTEEEFSDKRHHVILIPAALLPSTAFLDRTERVHVRNWKTVTFSFQHH